MPCRCDWPEEPVGGPPTSKEDQLRQDVASLKKRVDELTDLLCYVMDPKRKSNNRMDKKLADWWAEHQRSDAKRKAKKAKSK